MKEKTVEVIEKIRLVPPRIESYSTKMSGSNEEVEFLVHPEDGNASGGAACQKSRADETDRRLDVINQKLGILSDKLEIVKFEIESGLHQKTMRFFIVMIIGLGLINTIMLFYGIIQLEYLCSMMHEAYPYLK